MPGHVVVAEKRLWHKGVQQVVVPIERPGQLVEVAVVERAPRRLPQLVLRHGVDAGLGHEARVVAVDDLTEQPGVRMPGMDRSVTCCQKTVGTAYAASSRQPEAPRSSQ